jgi:hypothetical protein
MPGSGVWGVGGSWRVGGGEIECLGSIEGLGKREIKLNFPPKSL